MEQGRSAKTQEPFDLVLFLWAKRRMIIGVTAIGAVVGIITAFVITPLYRSEVVMFPAVTNSVSKALLNEISTGRDDILALGDEDDSEQLLQMLHSDRIRDRVSERFDLMTVYEVDSTSRQRMSDLQEAFDDHITFERTKFGSVRVMVLDPDPFRAADIANYISDQVDTVWIEMARERASIGVRLVQDKVNELEESLNIMTDSMQVLRELGVHDYHTQTERYNEYLGAAIVKGDKRAINEFEERFKVLAKYGGKYVTLQDRLYSENKRMSVLRMKLEQAKADLASDMPHKFVVNKAQPSDKKFSPIRWLVVLISTVSAFLLSLILIVIASNYQKLRNSHVE